MYIHKASQRSADIISQLMAFSRKQVIEPEIINLNPQITEMKKMLGRLLGENIDLLFIPQKDLWNIKVDLAFINGNFRDAWLRFRFQDSTANGWHISLEDTNFFDAPWQSYSVTFDTTWDDVTAMANGWVKESDGTLTATPSFSGLWDDVYTSEVRILADRGSVAGIDNYMASAVPVPAAVWLFGSGLIGLIGLTRRK